MTHRTDPAHDLSAIRSMMEKSSKILFLSGRAGIAVGIVALVGILYAQDIHSRVPPEDVQKFLIADALAVLVVAVALAIFYSGRMAKQKGLPMWNATAKHLVTEFSFPFAAGGLFCISLVVHKTYYPIPSAMLTFYGLALINASKYAVKEVRYLGLTQLAIGLVAAFASNEGLNLWALGFGIVHILFGLRIYFKYER